MDEREVHDIVARFSTFLAHAWQDVSAIARTDESGSLIDDWLQANWELLVEGPLASRSGARVVLEVYGSGADAYGDSSRIFQPEALPTHAVVCVPDRSDGVVVDALDGGETRLPPDGLPLEEFVSRDGAWYGRLPPFDCVLLAPPGGRELVIAQAELRFVLRAIGTDRSAKRRGG